MKKFKFGILWLFFVLIAFAVNAQNDTLPNLLNKNVDIANDSLSNDLTPFDSNNKLRLPGKQDKTRKEKANALEELAQSEVKNNNRVDALRYYLLAMYELEIIDDSKGVALVKERIGDVFFSAGIFEKALEYYKGAELLLLQNKIDLGESILLVKIGDTYFELKNYDQALIYYQRLGNVYEKSGMQTALLMNTYYNIIKCNNMLGFWEESLSYSLKILKEKEKSENIPEQITALNNIGYIYKNLEKYDLALDFLQQALDLEILHGLPASPATIVNIAVIYQNMGKPETSLDNLHLAAKLAADHPDKSKTGSFFHLIALVYFNMKDYYNAQVYNRKTLNFAQQSNNGVLTSEALLLSSRIAEAFYDYEGAMIDYQEYLDLKDSIQRNQQLNQTRLTETAFLIERISNETESLWASEEISYLELQRLKLDSANRQQELEIFYQSDSIQKITIQNQQLEKDQTLQALLFKEEQLYAQRKEKEVDSLRQIEKIQSLELETQQLVQQEQEAQIEILDKEKELSDLNLKKVRSRNRFLFGIILLVLVIMYIVYRALRYSKKTNKILIKQNNEIERQRDEIDYQRKRSDDLLLNILPEETAEELKEKGSATPKHYDLVSVLFTDFKGFTNIAEKLTPKELVAELDSCFFAFDKIIDAHNLEKIKTIGDAYMCAGGIPVANTSNPVDTVRAGLEIKSYMENLKAEREAKGEAFWELRIGIHTGQVVAGVVGKNKFAYDIWGDAVNTASRMESSGIPGKVNISGETYELVKDKFECSYRGKIKAKNKGEIDMYIVEGLAE